MAIEQLERKSFTILHIAIQFGNQAKKCIWLNNPYNWSHLEVCMQLAVHHYRAFFFGKEHHPQDLQFVSSRCIVLETMHLWLDFILKI